MNVSLIALIGWAIGLSEPTGLKARYPLALLMGKQALSPHKHIHASSSIPAFHGTQHCTAFSRPQLSDVNASYLWRLLTARLRPAPSMASSTLTACRVSAVSEDLVHNSSHSLFQADFYVLIAQQQMSSSHWIITCLCTCHRAVAHNTLSVNHSISLNFTSAGGYVLPCCTRSPLKVDQMTKSVQECTTFSNFLHYNMLNYTKEKNWTKNGPYNVIPIFLPLLYNRLPFWRKMLQE